MSKRILFKPHEYRELSADEQTLLAQAYHHAIDALHRNVTPRGFSACSLQDNTTYGTDDNYRSVWARDGAKTICWTIDLDDEAIRECQKQTLQTLLSHQSPTGQIPASVHLDTDQPEYAGVGGITSIDSGMWMIIAAWRYTQVTGDQTIVDDFSEVLQKTMDWLSAHDSNNCGLLEIPEAGDWADLFGWSYHVLYDEVLWFQCLKCYANLLDLQNDAGKAADYRKWAAHVGKVILKKFWPSTAMDLLDGGTTFSDVQYALGDARYLVAQISPFAFSWRCDVYGNLLAYLNNLVDRERAMMTFRFLWGVGINEPAPVENLYPPVQAGDREWRDYFAVNLLNLPHHYHNGGVWPFIGGLWVRYIHKLGMPDLARRELVKLARLCSLGISQEWEFNEWHHGVTGRPMGKAFQAWSAASFVKACHELDLEPDSIVDHI